MDAPLIPTDVPDRSSWLQNLGIAIEVLCPALAFVVLALRIYSRRCLNNFGWDDGCICIAMILDIAEAVASIKFMKLGYIGIHIWDTPPHDPTPALLWLYIVSLVYNPILAIVRASVLLFLLRLSGMKRSVTVAVWVIGAFNLCLMITVFISTIFMCDPIEHYWRPEEPGTCVNQLALFFSTAGLTVFTDLLVLALPFRIFLGLHTLARRAKIAILAVFLLGFIVVIVGAVRIYFFWAILEDPGPDPLFQLEFVITAIETNLAIIAACGPSIWPLARRWFPSFFANLGLERGFQGELPYIDGGRKIFPVTPTATYRNINSSDVVGGISGGSVCRDGR